jgi:hypothetical protein
MIFRGLRLLIPKFSTKYSQAMYEAWKANPKDVHDDWHAVFANQEKQSHVAVGTPEHIEREKTLALSAYMLIRYYKMRGHEEAVLDPLSTSAPIKDWSTSRNSARSTSRTSSITICSATRYFTTGISTSPSPSPPTPTSKTKSLYLSLHLGLHQREAAVDSARDPASPAIHLLQQDGH